MSRLLPGGFARRLSQLNIRIGLLTILAISGIVILNSHAFFHPWLNLGTPIASPQAGEKAIRILSAGPRSIRVATNHLRAFETDLPWIAWGKKPADFPWSWVEVPFEKEIYNAANFGCPYSLWVPPLIPAILIGTVDQIEVISCRMNVGIDKAKYVLLEDGSVWVWVTQRYKTHR